MASWLPSRGSSLGEGEELASAPPFEGEIVKRITGHDAAGLCTPVTQESGQATRIDISDTDNTACLQIKDMFRNHLRHRGTVGAANIISANLKIRNGVSASVAA